MSRIHSSTTMGSVHNHALWQTLAALVLFGVSFGYVEAAVVVYLRELYEPLALELNPEQRPGDLFPLVTLEQLEAADTPHLRLLKTEVIREAATLIMLVSIGLGGAIIVAAFCWDCRRVMARGMPSAFPWSIFLVGDAIGLAGFFIALKSSGQHRAPAA